MNRSASFAFVLVCVLVGVCNLRLADAVADVRPDGEGVTFAAQATPNIRARPSTGRRLTGVDVDLGGLGVGVAAEVPVGGMGASDSPVPAPAPAPTTTARIVTGRKLSGVDVDIGGIGVGLAAEGSLGTGPSNTPVPAPAPAPTTTARTAYGRKLQQVLSNTVDALPVDVSVTGLDKGQTVSANVGAQLAGEVPVPAPAPAPADHASQLPPVVTGRRMHQVLSNTVDALPVDVSVTGLDKGQTVSASVGVQLAAEVPVPAPAPAPQAVLGRKLAAAEARLPAEATGSF